MSEVRVNWDLVALRFAMMHLVYEVHQENHCSPHEDFELVESFIRNFIPHIERLPLWHRGVSCPVAGLEVVESLLMLG